MEKLWMSVSSITRGERATTVIAVCAVNPIGVYSPSMLILEADDFRGPAYRSKRNG